jgi:hypothetical protein
VPGYNRLWNRKSTLPDALDRSLSKLWVDQRVFSELELRKILRTDPPDAAIPILARKKVECLT